MTFHPPHRETPAPTAGGNEAVRANSEQLALPPVGRWAFFGGSFDPPHLGHLAVARAAKAALNLDTVLFAPVGAQPLKPTGSSARYEDRLAMTRLAIAHEPGFVVSLVDAPNPNGAPNYTLETLRKLRMEMKPESTPFCLMGADSFASLKYWHESAKIPFAASLIVASRPGEQWSNLHAALPAGLSIEAAEVGEKNAILRYLLRNPAGDCASFYLLPWLDVEISATEIRQQIFQNAEGKSGEPEFLSAPVSEYIRTHGLYL